MGVYVDDVRHSFGRMIMCHMWADSDEELLTMADKIGVKRKWIQGHPTLSFGKHRNASFVHFDISLGMKAKSLAAGAVLTDKYGPSEWEHRRRLANKQYPKEVHQRSRRVLRQIKLCRNREKGELNYVG